MDVQRDFFHASTAQFAAIAEPDAVLVPVEAHEHPYTEIALVLRGTAEHSSPLGIKKLERGDVVVIGQGAWHSYHNPEEFLIYNCYISGDIFNHSIEGFARNPALARLIPRHNQPLMQNKIFEGHIDEKSVHVCQQHLDIIFSLTKPYSPIGSRIQNYHLTVAEEARPTNDISLSFKVMAHLLFVLDEITINQPLELGDQTYNTFTHPAVQQVLELFIERPKHAWTMAELATNLYVDKSYLGRLFKSATGMSPMAYLAHYRAEQAAKLLVLSDMPVREIGQQVGWPEPAYFAERFRIHFGVSPRAYRIAQTVTLPGVKSDNLLDQD